MLPCTGGMTDACHCAQSLVEMGSLELFCLSKIIPISAFQIARITGFSHLTNRHFFAEK
jgi:hypothetical protein